MGKFVEAKNMRSSKREKLDEIIPLSTPFRIHIEPTNICNFKCRFCPTGSPELLKKVGRQNGSMQLSFFKKIIDQLREFPDRIKSLQLHKDGEPLVHPDFPEMYSYANEAGIAENLRIYTNGELLTPSIADKLLNSGLSWIGISVEAVSSERYFELTGRRVDYEAFLNNLRYLYKKKSRNCFVYAKIINAGLSEDEKRKFVNDFSPVSDSCAIENLQGWSMSEVQDFTLGNGQSSMDGIPLAEKIVCPLPFMSLAVNWNGSVSVCCADWAHETVVGDLNNETISEIWNGKALNEFRILHLLGRRKENKACANCKYLLTLPDNIDSSSAEILKKITK